MKLNTDLTNLKNTYGTSQTNGYSQEYVNNEVSKLLPSNLIRLDNVTTTTSLTFSAFSSQYVGVTVPTIDGYTPWLAYEVLGSGQSGIRGYSNPVNLSTMQVGCWVTNFTNTSQTIPGVQFKIMYIKNIQ